MDGYYKETETESTRKDLLIESNLSFQALLVQETHCQNHRISAEEGCNYGQTREKSNLKFCGNVH